MANSDNLVCFFESLQTLANRLNTGLAVAVGTATVEITRRTATGQVVRVGSRQEQRFSSRKFEKQSQQLSNWISTAQKNLSISSFPKPTSCNLLRNLQDIGVLPTGAGSLSGQRGGWPQAAITLMNSFQKYMQEAGINPSLSQSEFNSLVSVITTINRFITDNNRRPGT